MPLTRFPPIRSLAYIQPVIAELQQQHLPVGYLDFLRPSSGNSPTAPIAESSKFLCFM